MSSLTPAERADVESAKEAIRAAGALLDWDREIGSQLADSLGRALPDVDEVTIGRVLFYAAATIPQLVRTGHDPRAIGNAFTIAAIDLTALD
ncbi:hypothetical protein GCM10022224_035280 [Nonomuraea antimicrobica]|uniref:Uncharacterized protein n=2 Tax=Nonomuraea antimicrobica TaxID=561173 RepID=A0ABP7BUF3_9ACTN